jgi:outer membrane autotransporter protein
VESVAWQRDRFALIPSAGLRYAAAKMDSFKESTGGAPGAPIALEVDADHYNTLLFELGLLARAEVTRELSLWGELGVNVGVLDEGRSLSARFAKGGRTMRAEADGLDDDSVSLGFGAVYQITETINAGLGYRTDFRSGADNQHELRLSSSFRF